MTAPFPNTDALLLPTPPRDWQRRAANRYLQLDQKNFLAYITPAAGKTFFAGMIASELLRRKQIRQLLVIVHTQYLQSQWVSESQKLGWDLGTKPTRDRDGFVLTYQQLSDQNVAGVVNRIVRGPRRTLAVLDEVHHLGEDNSWEQGVRIALREVWRRLLLTGTPFRHDEKGIPYVRYIGGVGQADFAYSYGEALHDGIVSPIFFPTYGGTTRWRVGETETTASFGDRRLTQLQTAQQLNTAITDRTWLRSLLTDAHQRLLELRQYHPGAAGLVIARDQTHARAINRQLKKLVGESPVLVISDVDGSRELIEEFRTSHQPWIVSVKMVSEGVDIPRLRVGVYATNVRTELFFRQVIGRLVRLIQGVEDQSAYLYMPCHPLLQKFAHEIAQERQPILRERQARAGTSGLTLQHLEGISATAIAGSILLPGGEFTPEELEVARQVRDGVGLGYLSLEVVAKLLRAQAAIAPKV